LKPVLGLVSCDLGTSTRIGWPKPRLRDERDHGTLNVQLPSWTAGPNLDLEPAAHDDRPARV